MIFEKELEKIQKMDKTTIETLASLQEHEFEVLKREAIAIKAIERLEEIIKAIKTRDFSKIEKYIKFSGSGDGYGSENHYISFEDITQAKDIGKILKILDVEETLEILYHN